MKKFQLAPLFSPLGCFTWLRESSLLQYRFDRAYAYIDIVPLTLIINPKQHKEQVLLDQPGSTIPNAELYRGFYAVKHELYDEPNAELPDACNAPSTVAQAFDLAY